MKLPFVTLDVFTTERLTGNPLAVVFGGEDLSTERMQAIAGEFNLSETVFVLPAEVPFHSAKVRIFTPTAELPFAGHPTIGTAIAIGEKKVEGQEGNHDLLVVLEEGVGPVRAAVKILSGKAPRAVFDVPRLPEAAPGEIDRDEIAAALGLSRHQIGFENHKITRFTCGVPYTYVPVAGLDEIASIKINTGVWKSVFGLDDHAAAYVYCRETTHHNSDFHARMFAPEIGVQEDPATGSAAAAFAGVVAKFDKPTDGATDILIEQGYEMGRPSHIELEVEMEGGALAALRIGGHAVRVSEGMIEVG